MRRTLYFANQREALLSLRAGGSMLSRIEKPISRESLESSFGDSDKAAERASQSDFQPFKNSAKTQREVYAAATRRKENKQ